MLGRNAVVAFVPTRDPARARKFYEQTLGLEYVSEDLFALVFNANGVTIRVVNVSNVKDFKPQPFTILGWKVEDITVSVLKLHKKGVMFERFPGMKQDSYDIWTSPSGAYVAWFKDPDGNVLSITQS